MDKVSLSESMWKELLSLLSKEKEVHTFKEQATFKVISFSD
ncbi:hypothetical protein [Anoxybacillus ayderensis]|nr:hypothetical protein [Anoxybacillus ayderensis]